MPLPALRADMIALGASAQDWRGAVRLAGEALVRAGACDDDYPDRMIDVIEEFGAYVVIAPGLALAHARPGPDVHRDALSVVTLAEPVSFGHPHNDPVRVVLGLCVTGPEEHVSFVAGLANVFNDPEAIPRVAEARTADEVLGVFDAPTL